jgi:hypothetical protein
MPRLRHDERAGAAPGAPAGHGGRGTEQGEGASRERRLHTLTVRSRLVALLLAVPLGVNDVR